METEVVRRRINRIAGHVAPTNNDIMSSITQLLPLNCRSSLNSVIRRCDNRMYFARQASDSQACFMRQISSEQSSCNASEAPLFARPCLSLKGSGITNEGSCNVSPEAPLFSRPARMEPSFPNFALMQPLLQDCELSVPDLPNFAKPDRRIVKQQRFGSKKNLHSFKSNGLEWSPRMNVSELGSNYVMTIEIPGAGINDLKVEVDGQNLTVLAKHSNECWKVAGYSNGSVSAYHRREEPYHIVWSLPTDVNKDTISAEFLNGLLQIVIPKL